MPHCDRQNPISWSIVLAVTATLSLAACSPPGELSNAVATLRDRAEADTRDALVIDEASQALGAACEEAGAPVAIIARPGQGG